MGTVRNHLVVISFCFMLFLSGCWDIDEADRMNYVIGMGIDYEDGETVLHLQIPNLVSLGSPEVTPENARAVTIATERGETLAAIAHNIYLSAQRKLYFGHNTLVILTERALEEGLLKEAIDKLNRFPQTRYRVNFFATKSDLSELLQVTTLFENSSILTRITDTENTYELNSLIKNLSMRSLIIQLTEPGYNGIIPTIELNSTTWKGGDGKINAVESTGVAVATPKELFGFIEGDDVKGIRWLQESIRNNVMLEIDGKPAGEYIFINPRHKIKLEKSSGGKYVFHINVKTRGISTEVLEPVQYEEVVRSLSETIEEEIKATYLKGLEMGTDIYRLSEHMYRYDLPLWKQLQEDGTVPLEEDSIQVKVDVDLNHTSVDKMAPTVQ